MANKIRKANTKALINRYRKNYLNDSNDDFLSDVVVDRLIGKECSIWNNELEEYTIDCYDGYVEYIEYVDPFSDDVYKTTVEYSCWDDKDLNGEDIPEHEIAVFVIEKQLRNVINKPEIYSLWIDGERIKLSERI